MKYKITKIIEHNNDDSSCAILDNNDDDAFYSYKDLQKIFF